jgi:type II secretion system protein H
MSRSPAFTLLELMVVITLIGILSAMILPQMRGTYGDALLRSTARELVSVLTLASSRAVSSNQAHRLHLDLATGRYLIERRVQENGEETDFAPATDILGSEGTLDTRIAIQIHKTGLDHPDPALADAASFPDRDSAASQLSSSVAFFPDGTAEAADVLLRDQEGFRIGLRVNPVTARVRLLELDRE